MSKAIEEHKLKVTVERFFSQFKLYRKFTCTDRNKHKVFKVNLPSPRSNQAAVSLVAENLLIQ